MSLGTAIDATEKSSEPPHAQHRQKAAILVTRKLPAPVEARLVRDFDAVLNKEDKLYGRRS